MNSTPITPTLRSDWDEGLVSPLIVDRMLEPMWVELVLLMACHEIARLNELTLKEQMQVWRPFDV